MTKTVRRWSFWSSWSKEQLPLFMIWDEEWENGNVVHARVILNSQNVTGC